MDTSCERKPIPIPSSSKGQQRQGKWWMQYLDKNTGGQFFFWQAGGATYKTSSGATQSTTLRACWLHWLALRRRGTTISRGTCANAYARQGLTFNYVLESTISERTCDKDHEISWNALRRLRWLYGEPMVRLRKMPLGKTIQKSPLCSFWAFSCLTLTPWEVSATLRPQKPKLMQSESASKASWLQGLLFQRATFWSLHVFVFVYNQL